MSWNRHPVRQYVRNAMRQSLVDPVNGFNPCIKFLAPFYNVEPFQIDWDEGSETFLESFVEQGPEDSTRLLRTVRCSLYTSLAQQSRDDASATKSTTFWGEITAHFDVMIEFQEGIELVESVTEAPADMIEEAVLAIVVDPKAPNHRLFRSGPIYFSGDYACPREPILQSAAGYSQRLPFTFIYEVHT